MQRYIQQPYRNPEEYACYLAGVKAAAAVFASEFYVDACGFVNPKEAPTKLSILTKPGSLKGEAYDEGQEEDPATIPQPVGVLLLP